VYRQGIAVLVVAYAVVEFELSGLGSRYAIETERRTTGYRRAIVLCRISTGRQQSYRSGYRRTNVIESLEQVRLTASVGSIHRGHWEKALPVRTHYEGALELPHRSRLHGKLGLIAIGSIVPESELAKHRPQHSFHYFEKIYQSFSLIIEFK